MFSFHRPKVYRSPTGCCICKAKSSSSRFTDSKKYEEDFLECFKLVTPRQGEICNACVLLVKRWKKLPAGSDRNWQHVVDARAGPGMKSFTKFKTKNKKLLAEKNLMELKAKKEKHEKQQEFEREFSPPLSDKSDIHEDMDVNEIDFLTEEVPSINSSRNGSPGESDNEDLVAMQQLERSRRRKGKSRRRDDSNTLNVSGFIDLDYWKKEMICCGTIFRGENNDVLIDPSYLKPCSGRLAMMCKAKTAQIIPQNSPSSSSSTSSSSVKGVYSDSSSDSGYDDCSNQGLMIAMSPPVLGAPESSAHHHHHRAGVVANLMCHETIFNIQEEPEPEEEGLLIAGAEDKMTSSITTSTSSFVVSETVIRN